MGVPLRVQELYAECRPYLDALDAYIAESLSPYCERRQFTFLHRIKTLESASEKLESGRYSSWADLDDLVAATIVVPNLSHEATLRAHLAAVFEQTNVRSRDTAETPPDVFRFNSTRWYGRVRSDPPPPSLPDRSHGIVFEIQIQTVFEHAWLVATHDLTYKGATVNWKELRLAAALRATVEQIDSQIESFVEAAGRLPTSPFPETDARNFAIERFQALISEGLVNESLAPTSWSRFSENLLNLVRSKRSRQQAPSALRDLIDGVEDAVRRGILVPAISGSLYQMVVSYCANHSAEYLERTNIVASAEFSSVYLVGDPPRPIDMTF